MAEVVAKPILNMLEYELTELKIKTKVALYVPDSQSAETARAVIENDR